MYPIYGVCHTPGVEKQLCHNLIPVTSAPWDVIDIPSTLQFTDYIAHLLCRPFYTVVAKSFRAPTVFPLNPLVSKSYKIECCGNKMHETNKTMILTRVLELILNLL